MDDDCPQGLGDDGCVWGVGDDGDLYGVAGAVAEEWCALDGGGAGFAVVVGDLVSAFTDVLGDGGCYAVSVDEVLEVGCQCVEAGGVAYAQEGYQDTAEDEKFVLPQPFIAFDEDVEQRCRPEGKGGMEGGFSCQPCGQQDAFRLVKVVQNHHDGTKLCQHAEGEKGGYPQKPDAQMRDFFQ